MSPRASARAREIYVMNEMKRAGTRGVPVDDRRNELPIEKLFSSSHHHYSSERIELLSFNQS